MSARAWPGPPPYNGEQDLYFLRIGDDDCNVNGISDTVDIAGAVSADANANGIPDECEDSVGTPGCFGVGCPCANDDPLMNGAGCANSTGSGALLAGVSSNSVIADDFALSATGLPAFNSGLFYMGDTQMLNPFFDGLQCALGQTLRFIDSAQDSGPGGILEFAGVVSGSSGFITPGSTWHFHAWHRDVAGSPCATGANLSNLLSVTFGP